MTGIKNPTLTGLVLSVLKEVLSPRAKEDSGSRSLRQLVVGCKKMLMVRASSEKDSSGIDQSPAGGMCI